MKPLLLLVSLLPAAAFGSAVTSAQSGDWNNSTTWAGGVVPGNGDTVTIAGAHTITIPAGTTVTVGTSPADDTGLPAVQCASATSAGVLEVRGTLIFRGPVRQCNSQWTLYAGATVTHDSSLAPVPSAASYTWQIGLINGQTAAKLVALGARGSRVTLNVAANSGRAGGFIGATATTQSSGQLQASWLRATGWGSATGYFVRSSLDGPETAFFCDNCLIDNCGRISVYALSPASIWRLKNTTVTNPVPASNHRYIELGAGYISGPPTTGQRLIQNCYIEGRLYLVTGSGNINPGVRILNNVFVSTTAASGIEVGNTPMIADGDWSDVLIYSRVAANTSPVLAPFGTLKRTYMLRTGYPGDSSANPHFLYFGTGSTWDSPVTVDTWLFEGSTDASANGDFIQISGKKTSGGPQQVVIRNNLVIPTVTGQSVGILANTNGSGTCNGTTLICPQVYVERNTWPGYTPSPANGQYGLGGESTTGYDGIYQHGRNNIVWRSAPGPGVIAQWQANLTPADNAFRNLDYNVWWNLTGTRYGRSDTLPNIYNPTPPGSHDVNADPGFVEIRNFLAFGRRWKPSAASWADVLAEFARMNDDAGYDTRFNVPDLINWVRAGYRPRNPLVWRSGHDGSYGGAVPPSRSFGSAGNLW